MLIIESLEFLGFVHIGTIVYHVLLSDIFLLYDVIMICERGSQSISSELNRHCVCFFLSSCYQTAVTNVFSYVMGR